ncbi:hypothetical protein L211DRAFT_850629 [Terfezia boudieri ATCC MYA-4762]|uniref:Uncharacterized protein n=1 Tax=Terfezia boudieri ATCC MYA-4762 TaxID=1051890 RepID=A0A3N4LLG2_9PEZI|nr:hypothetical protein L211DRAFT_850629 [Terfezia boudieri ATCC MYA-4762]
MPTAANAINNSIDLLGWPHTIVGGGKRKNSSRYTTWRNEVEVRIRAKGWQWKKDGGNDYDGFLMECVGLDDFPASGAAVIRWDPKTDDTKPAHKALNELMLDCFKKVRESRGKRKRAAAQEALVAEAGQVEDEEGADAEGRAPSKRRRFYDGRPVVIYILDPEDTVSSQLPDGRKVREIIGSLEDPDPAAGDPLMISIATTHIQSDDELDAFLRLTEARLIKLLIVLHRDPAVRANSPPPAGCNANTYYFNLGRFDGPEYYMDEIEDSEEEVTKRTGGRRGVPRKDHKFEESLEACRRRIRRQERVLAVLEGKYKAAFPNAIHESDAGGGLRVLCYGEEDELTGKQVVQFRVVVADYVTDLVARMVANAAAGGGLTNRQLIRRAVRHVKAEINGGVTYAALGLPQTEA